MFKPRLAAVWFSAIAVATVGMNEPAKDAATSPVARHSDQQEHAVVKPRDFFVIRSIVRVEAAQRSDGSTMEGMRVIALAPKQPSDEGIDAVGGNTVALGDTFMRAILSNVGAVPVILNATTTDRTYRLAPGETAVIAARMSCSVSCRDGAFACCNALDDWTVECLCRPDRERIECQSGGIGATGCGVTGD